MSLERELVFNIMDNGASKEDVPNIVRDFQSPELDKKYGMKLGLDSKKIKVALSQYEAKQELEKRGEYKKPFKEKIRKLIEEEIRKIEDTHPNLLSVRIHRSGGYSCGNCDIRREDEISAIIKYVKRNGGVPAKLKKKKMLFYCCKNCGYIE